MKTIVRFNATDRSVLVALLILALSAGTGAFVGCGGCKPPPVVPVVVDPPAPIPDAGLHVLIVFDTDQIPTPAQMEIVHGNAAGSVRAYLDGLRDAGKVEYRILDETQPDDLSRDSPSVQAMYKLGHKSLPWLVVSNGKTGYQGPLPATAAECLSLIQKYEVK